VSRVKELDSARGLAAIIVVAYHCVYTINIGEWQSNPYLHIFEKFIFLPAKFGEFAVYFFMAISGYVLAMMANRNSFLSKKQWMIWRSMRLVPLYYLSLILAMCVSIFLSNHKKNNLQYFLHSYLFSNSNIYSGDNPPLWSLSVEIILSLLFFSIIRFERLIHSRIFVVTILMYAGTYLADGWGVRALLRSLIYFIIGVSIYLGAKNWSDRKVSLNILVFLNLLLALSLIPRSRELLTLLQILTIPLTLAFCLQSERKILSESKILAHLGKISFTMYVFHWPILQIFHAKTKNTEISLLQDKITAVPIALLLVIVISNMLFFLFEKNIISLSKIFLTHLRT